MCFNFLFLIIYIPEVVGPSALLLLAPSGGKSKKKEDGGRRKKKRSFVNVADACLFCVYRQIIKKKKSLVMMLDNDEDIIKKIVLSFEVTVFVLMTYICLGKFLFFSCWWL